MIGYGAETINILRDLCPSASPSTIMEMPKKLAKYLLAPVTGNKSVIEFPLTLGRDFAGVVSRVGHGVKTDVRVGDEVYGVVGVQRQGSHAQYVVVTEDTVRSKKTYHAKLLKYNYEEAYHALFFPISDPSKTEKLKFHRSSIHSLRGSDRLVCPSSHRLIL